MRQRALDAGVFVVLAILVLGLTPGTPDGRTLDRLGLTGMNAPQIRSVVEEGFD